MEDNGQQKQTTFDIVCAHLLTQNKQTKALIGGRYQCAYRAPDGCKCAVGCLIPDDKYTPDMEGKGLTHEKVWNAIPNKHRFEYMLSSLQYVHDKGTVPSWPARLAVVAYKHNLKVPACVAQALETGG